ncbi:MAG: putative sulfate exporter family transporter, partial [Calditrichia bacterium]
LQAFYLNEEQTSEIINKAKQKYGPIHDETIQLKEIAVLVESAAIEADYVSQELNAAAEEAINDYRMQKRKDSKAKKKTKTKSYSNIVYLFTLGVFIGVLFAVGMQVMQGNGLAFLKGFIFVYVLAILAYFIAGQVDIKAFGIGYAAWAIILGLLISNTIGTPAWVMPAVQVEYFIKTGLVLLGAEILFGKILTIGIPGIFVAWVVTPVVLITTFWFGQQILKIPSKTLNITMSADMSVCGVSAAIATAAACRAKKEELTLAVGISLIFTSIMMIVMPNIINAVGMDHVLGGAWMGGTIDATGAVAAAGAFLSDKALYVATTVKLIQNILIGVIAFAVALYWVTCVETEAGGSKPNAIEIWYRFPKFVIGFIVASIMMSLIYEFIGPDHGRIMINDGVIGGWTKIWRGWFFCLAFVSIGLATDFRQLMGYLKGGKPLILYLCGQTLNLTLTFLMAYLMFFVIFPDITATI